MKILMVVSQIGFKDEEYFIPFELFKGLDVDTASLMAGKAVSVQGKEIDVISLDEVDSSWYSAIVLIGGPGSKALVGVMILEKLLKEFSDKLIAAICYSPVVLAKSGILRGKRATVWNADGLQSVILKENAAEYVDEPVVVDGNIITANGPSAAPEFAKKILEKIKN